MSRFTSAAVLSLVLLLPPGTAAVAVGPDFTPGAPGIGDPYYPLDGNGGYDVRSYDLDLTYDPGTDALDGRAVITAHATQDLSAFNLDLSGLRVESVVVDGRPARWSHADAELTVTPPRGLRERSRFRVVVEYSGVPETLDEFGPSGFMHTADGAIVVGQPHVAATWFPANDHPSDKASYRLAITVPEGLEAISNGLLRGTTTSGGWSTWRWHAREPMASYLAFMAIGEFDVREYRENGIRFLDALDRDLFVTGPRTGERAAYSGGGGQPAYHRLTRTLTVPPEGGTVSFWVDRTAFPGAQFMVVEVRPVGTDRWTTLPDGNGHTASDVGFVCPFWLEDHPFLTHYLTAAPDGSGCAPTGTTGEWFAGTGESDGFEQWSVSLGDVAGQAVELSIAYVAPGFTPFPGLVVDDVVVSWGEGTTGFEDDGDTLDGWTPTGPPVGSPPNTGAWTVGTADEATPSFGDLAEASLARQPEIIRFLEGVFGRRYPFRASGGVVSDHEGLFFALETQTRPVYSRYFFTDPVRADVVVVHELAHQWTGNDLTLERWQHIWLHEGFATYAEWLWQEAQGVATGQEIFDGLADIPADDPFWEVVIGDPGTDLLFDDAVFNRGAMTLHALRQEVGDDAFFRILRTWVREQRGGLVTTDRFVAVAERVSGQDLDELFRVWLFTGERPASLPEPTPEPEPAGTALRAPDPGTRLGALPALPSPRR